MKKWMALKPKFVQFVPKELEEGILYVSQMYGVCIHLCACGCRNKVVTPIESPGSWTLTVIGEGDQALVTLSPSIGNWQIPCKTHYFIQGNTVKWC